LTCVSVLLWILSYSKYPLLFYHHKITGDDGIVPKRGLYVKEFVETFPINLRLRGWGKYFRFPHRPIISTSDDIIVIFCYITRMKTNILICTFLCVLCGIVFYSCATSVPVVSRPVGNLTPEQLKSLIDRNAPIVLVDTRTEYEFRKGRIPGAILVSPDKFGSLGATLPPDKSAHLIFYCRGAA
jgi:hypothetical protein